MPLSTEYFRWLKGQPCAWPHCREIGVEVHHYARRPVARKCSDYLTVPICTAHHRMLESPKPLPEGLMEHFDKVAARSLAKFLEMIAEREEWAF